MKRMILLCAVTALGLAVQPAVADFSSGFEPGEVPGPDPPAGYTFGLLDPDELDHLDTPVPPDPENVVGQGGWETQFGGPWWVADYAGTAGGVPWVPQSTGLENYNPPNPNPHGGENYIGKGTTPEGGSGGGRIWHAATYDAGFVTVTVDMLNGPEHDFPLYQAGVHARDNWDGDGLGNSAGFYTRSDSDYVETEPPRQGDWAVGWQLWNAEGVQMKNPKPPIDGITYMLIDEPGFDHLPRETWHRLSFTMDLNPGPESGKYVQFRSQNLETCEEWIIENPVVMWDDPLDDPDLGPQPYEPYINGGGAGDPADLDAVGFYNVGNGQVHLFDNVGVGSSYTPIVFHWQGGSVPDGSGLFSASNWRTGPNLADQAPAMDGRMVIDATTDGGGAITGPSLVTVDADFIAGGSGPIASVSVGAEGDEDNGAKLVVAAGVTLEIEHGYANVYEFGKIAVENGATLDTCGAFVEVDGRYISGVQGTGTGGSAECGLLKASKQITLDEFEDAGTLYGGPDAVSVDWMLGQPNPADPAAAATAKFGGIYRIAEYVGQAIGDTWDPGTKTSNEDANIGAAYIKSVNYAVDVNGNQTLYAIDVELHPQTEGDSDLDGAIGPADLQTLVLAWDPGASTKTWFDADFEFNGNVGPGDLQALVLGWAPGGITFPAGADINPVPEPGTILMLLVGMAGLLIYRKRR